MKSVAQIRKESPQERRFGRFLLKFRYRNPDRGDCPGSGGVQGDDLIDVYGGALERLQNILAASPHNRRLPSGDVEVFVADLDDSDCAKAIMFAIKGKPKIVLPCRTCEATAAAESLYAEVCALHEASHVLCHVDQPYAGKHFEAWRWFNEATAVWTEMMLSPNNPSTSEYWSIWCDGPQHSLNAEPYWYGAGLFAAYLESSVGPGFIGKVWKESLSCSTPIEAILKLKTPKTLFHRYSVESFFAHANGRDTIFANALRRFGGRAVSKSLGISESRKMPVICALPPLSTHYYRIWAESTGGWLSLKDVSGLKTGVAASLSLASRDWVRLDDGPPEGSSRVNLPLDDSKYAVLVISNNGTCSSQSANVECELLLS